MGEQTLPQLTLDSRGNAARAAFPWPWCGQVATPKGGGSWFGVWPVSAAGFLVSAPTVDETAFDFVASIARFREDSSQPLDMPRFSPDFFISNLF